MILALNASLWLVISAQPGDPGGRKLYRTQGLIWLAGVVVTFLCPISKFHLLWVYPLGAFAPYAIMHWRLQRTMDLGTSPMAMLVKQHLEQRSGGQVWNWPEMLRTFKVSGSIEPDRYASIIKASEAAQSWVAQEPGVGQVAVIRRADKVKGTLLFIDQPRFYFCWRPD